jgi:hypothetical protein
MSRSTKNDTLCERCSLLSFDDLALGGQEVLNEDGIARLYFPESQTETRPLVLSPAPYDKPFYRLVSLGWKVEDILPDFPQFSQSSQIGCVFCQALIKSLEAISYSICDGTVSLVAYLSLGDEGIKELLVEAAFNQGKSDETASVIQILFPIEADKSK